VPHGARGAITRPRPPAEVPDPGLDSPPPQHLEAVSISPPGESGFFSLAGQQAYEATGEPSAFGPHVDDQRLLYWTFGYTPAGFAQPTGEPERPTPGSRLYRDAYGVPVVYGGSAHDVWFAVGWAFAQDRLFEMDLLRRSASGRLAELIGPSALPSDVQARVVGYTDAEYAAMFADLLDEQDRVVVVSLVEGINAWLADVAADPERLLPAEYLLFSAFPETWEVRDVLATAVDITRSVASAGGNEMTNVANLVTLQQAFPEEQARGIFQDLFWLEDAKAVTTVPGSSGRFPNSTSTPSEREAVFQAMADYAETLPPALANGPGTGAYQPPPSVSGTGEAAASVEQPTAGVPSAAERLRSLRDQLPPAARAALRRAQEAVTGWASSLHGGSYQLAVGPSRTDNAKPLLISGPQLGYGYPSQLYELEVHGGGYHARGATVPGLPVVGIGYTSRCAWALTTGESKTIDSFIETTRSDPVANAPQYLFDGTWRDQDCREEVVRYRPVGADGLPDGPATLSVTVPVCRTIHGPIVASVPGPAGSTGLARSLALAMWMKELRTISGILQWNRSESLADFAAGVARVTWNENTMYADADGNIAYWHPGLYPIRSPKVDLRFPTPGTGGYEWEGFLAFNQMPHALNPAQGYLANWNTKPSVGWLEEATIDPGQPGGAFQRVQDITSQVEGRRGLGLADLAAIDRYLGITDHRARAFVPLLEALQGEETLSNLAQEALATVVSWDYAAYDPPPGVERGVSTDTTDGPAPTIFSAFVTCLHQQLFGTVPASVVASDNQPNPHIFDIRPIDNLAMRILEPSTSALTTHHDYLAGRSPLAVVAAALEGAVGALVSQYGTSDLAVWRRPHQTSPLCSLTGGVIGPCLAMPFEDRGTYIHHVHFR
jgi:penicillin amidase